MPTAAEFHEGYKEFFKLCVRPSQPPLYNDFDGDDLTIGQGIICPFRRNVPVPSYDSIEFSSSFYTVIGLDTDISIRAKCVIKHLSHRLSCTECLALLLKDTDRNVKHKNIDFYEVVPSRFLAKILAVTWRVLPKPLLKPTLKYVEHLVIRSFTDCLDLTRDMEYLSCNHVLEEPHHIISLIKAVIRTFINFILSSTKHRSTFETRLMKEAKWNKCDEMAFKVNNF